MLKTLLVILWVVFSVNADCGGCSRNCGLLDLICWGQKALCTAFNIPYKTVTYSIRTYCIFQSQSPEDVQKFQEAQQILVDYGWFVAEDYNGVSFRYCDVISTFAGGMAPTPDMVLFSNRYYQGASAFQLASNIMAHEMFHIIQYRELGHAKFACEYSLEILAGRIGRANALEIPAYEFEDEVERCLISNIGCPTS